MKVLVPKFFDCFQMQRQVRIKIRQWIVNVVNEIDHISEKKKKDVQELLKVVQLSEEDQQYYGKALQDVVSDVAVQDHSKVVYDEQEPFL
ncbi:hypothetical protein J6590_075155 [Homalodisca vitripennis]|nr:hypothetical protein J6590_075155 [Homalodisca vitripennis]